MPRKTSPTLSDAVEQYTVIQTLTKAKTTVANTASCLRRMAREIGANRQVHTLQHQDLERWFAIEASRTQASSFNKSRQRVSGFISFLVERGWLSTNVLSQVGRRRVTEKVRLRLSRTQLVQLVEQTTNERDRAVLALGINTALRASDLIRLRVGDLDLETGTLRVLITKTQRRDEIPVTSDLDAAMRRWLRYYSERLALVGRALTPEDYLTPTLSHSNIRHGSQVYPLGDPRPNVRLQHCEQIIHRALERIGITETSGHGVHLLRRSTARVLYESLVEQGSYDHALKIVGALLGHQNAATTEVYLGLEYHREIRDDLLRGKSFLTSSAEVTPLRSAQ